jgi:hypothetical protein
MRSLNRHFFAALFLMVSGAVSPSEVQGQITWRDLVFTGGLSAERYKGNLATVTVSVVDCIETDSGARECTEDASAVMDEFGIRGGLLFFNHQKRSLELQFDAGVRQFVARGFKVRDYVPREWVGHADLRFEESIESVGTFFAEGGLGARKVEDRPPMPLFIQPGYTTLDGAMGLRFLPLHGSYLDLRLFGEKIDAYAGALTPQLDLLDRQVLGGEAGVAWGSDWMVRLHSGYRASEYRNQGTFDPDDPFRRDRTLSYGATWTFMAPVFAQIGIEGMHNRSNSSRPEYNAVSLRGVLSAPLPYDLTLNVLANLTNKEYLTETDYARLVPGEEADNASVVYLELARPLMVNLDGAVRFGWNRAETDTGNEYFEKYGATFLLRYRPWAR